MKIDTGKMNKKIKLITSDYVGNDPVPKEVTVWAEKKSVNRNEFYTSYQSGLIPQVIFKIRAKAYKLSLVTDPDNTKRYANTVIFDGMYYNVIRTYEEDEVVELTCS